MEDNKLPRSEQGPLMSPDSLDITETQGSVASFANGSSFGQAETLEVHQADSALSKHRSSQFISPAFSLSRRRATLISTFITLIVVSLTAISALVLLKNDDNNPVTSKLSGIESQDAIVEQPSGDFVAAELKGTEDAVLVNGDLITKGLLKVVNNGFTTIIQPQNSTANQTLTLPNASGTLCLDNNNCNFVTQQQLATLANQLGQIVIPTIDPGVQTLNGQKGAISIQGVSNQISVISNGNVVTLATPQDIAPISSPTFSSLILTNNFTVNGSINTALNCTGNLNGGLLTTDNNGQIICDDDDGGSGAGVGTPGGTAGRIALFTGAQTIADSIISEALGTITVSGALAVTGNVSANSLSLAMALGVANGGTGAASFNSNGVVIGNGSGALTTTAAPSAGQVLLGNAGGVPVFISLSGDIAVGSTGVTTIQANSVDLGLDTTGNYVASLAAGNGISVSAAGEGVTNTIALTALTSNWNQTGAFDIVLNNANSELRVLESNGGTFFGTIDVGDLSVDRTYVFPDADGTVCLDSGNCVGSGGGAPNGAGYLTVGNDATLSGERAITAGTNLSATDGGANSTYALNVANNPTFSGLITANGGLNLGTQTLQGTTAVIDFTNFDVNSAGAVSANSLTLTTALSVTNGGTGRTTLTTNGVLYGAGTAGINATLAPTSAQILVGNAGGAPVFVSMTGDIAISSTGLTTIQGDSVALGTDTTGNYVASITAGNGISVGAAGEGSTPTLALGSLSADWNQTGAFDIVLNNASSELRILESIGGAFYGSLDVGDLSANRTYSFPDADGTVCLDSGNCVGSGGGAPNNAAYLTVGGNATLSNERAITAGSNLSATDGGANSTYTFDIVSNPTFAGLITANGGVSLGTQSLQGTTAIIDFTNFDVDAGGNMLAGTLNGQVISSAASFTGSLTVATDLAVNGNVTIGNASSDTITLNGTIQGGTPFILEGATANAHQITIAVEDPTADLTYRIPFVGGNADFCLSTGNCAGSGGGVTTSGGTTNSVAKFTGSQSLGDSTIIDDGTDVSITGDFTVQGGNITFGSSSQVGSIVLHDGDGQTISLNVPNITSSYSLLLPNSVGSANQCLKAQDGSGTLYWDNCLGGGGGGAGISTINGQTGPSITINNATGAGNAITLDNAAADGTTKGIASFNATNFTASTGVINTAQNINTAAAPTFAGLSLTGNLQVSNNTISGGTATIDFTNFDVNGAGNVTAASLSLGSALSVLNGGTGVTSFQANGILYGNGTGSLQVTGTAANSILATDASNIPSLTQTLPLVVQGNISALGTITSGIWNGTAILDTYVSDTLTIDAASTVDWGALNNYPAACAAGQAVTQLGDTITCQAFASGVGSGNYIQNQNAVQQTAADFWISGTGRLDTSLLTPTIDVATASILNIGGTATAIAIADDTTIAAGKFLRITGDATAGRPVTPGEGTVFYDTTTKQLLVYANGKWQADRAESVIVAANNSSQAVKDRADYVATGSADQTTINAALTAAAGGKVYLTEGTFITSNVISIPNNTSLVGSGFGTMIQFSNITGQSRNMITNTTANGTGSGITISNMRLDGNDAVNTSGTQHGIYINNFGNTSGIMGVTITQMHIANFRDRGIYIDTTQYSLISENTLYDNDTGVYVNGTRNTITSNTSTDNASSGIVLNGMLYGVVTNNKLHNNGTYGLYILGNSSDNNVSNNAFRQNGGSTTNNAIYVNSSDSNNFFGNVISDTSCSTTCYAINISDVGSDTNYLGNNNLGNGSVNDLGTATVYGGQVNGSGNYLLQPTGTIELLKNSNITGTLGVTGLATLSGGLTASGGAITLTSNANASLTSTAGQVLVQSTNGTNIFTAANGASNTAAITIMSGASGAGSSGGIYIDNGSYTSGTPTLLIGNNNAANIGIGNTNVTTTTLIQGGTSSSALALATGTGGRISIGTTNSSQVFIGNANAATTINGALSVTNNFTVANTGNVAFQRNTSDITSTGTLNDLNIGSGALFRFNGASAQTLSSIANPADGRTVTLINVAATSLTIQNDTGGTAANRIITGIGGNMSILTGGSINLVYDSGASRWRVIGAAAAGSGGANQALSNLSGVAVNTSLNPNADNTLDLGSAANSWRSLYADTSVLSPSIDRASAGTLSIGNTNATTINIGSNNAGHTINIGTGNSSQVVSLGSDTNSSYLYLAAGSLGSLMNVSGDIAVDLSGVYTIGNQSGVNYMSIDSTTGEVVFRYESTVNIQTSAVIHRGLTLANGADTTFTTPGGYVMNTRLSVESSNIGAGHSLIAAGLTSASSSGASGFVFTDARTSNNNYPSIGVYSPDEGDIMGFSWDGSNSTGYLKTTGGDNIGIKLNNSVIAQFDPTAIYLNQSSEVLGTLTVKSTPSPSTDDRIALSVTTGGVAGFTGSITNGDLTAARTWSLPNESGTFCMQGSTTCGFAPANGGSGYIANQTGMPQTADFEIIGDGQATNLTATNYVYARELRFIDGSGNTVGGISYDANGVLKMGTLNGGTSGSIAIGQSALQSNNAGVENIAIGKFAMDSASSGSYNTAIGVGSANNTTGDYNLAVGFQTGRSISTGSRNTFLGMYAGSTIVNPSWGTAATIQRSTGIGYDAQVQANDSIVLGSVEQGTKIGIGTTIPQNILSVSPVSINASIHNGITASQSGNTVTSSGSIFSASNVGDTFIWANDLVMATVTGYISPTQVTISTSATRGSNYFRTHKAGLQVATSGRVGIGTTTPGADLDLKTGANTTTAFRIQDSAGTDLLVADTTNMKLTVRNLEVTFNLTVNGHIISGGGAPNITAGAGACSSPTVSVTGTDTSGVISLTTSASCTSGELFDIAFNTAFSAAPNVTMTPASAAASLRTVYVNSNTGSFTVYATGPPESTFPETYDWTYHVIQ